MQMKLTDGLSTSSRWKRRLASSAGWFFWEVGRWMWTYSYPNQSPAIRRGDNAASGPEAGAPDW